MAVLKRDIQRHRMDLAMQFQLAMNAPPARIESLDRRRVETNPLESGHVEYVRAEHSRLYVLAVFR